MVEVNEALVMSIPAAGKLLNLSRPTMYKLAKAGKLPILRLGRKLVIPRAALERMLAEVKPANAGQPVK